MKKVLSLSPLGIDLMKGLLGMCGYTKGDVEFVTAHGKGTGEIVELSRGAMIIIADHTFATHMDDAMISALKGVKLIQNLSVGYQHIDVEACTRAGIAVANTAGANTVGVAEHTIALALALLKNLFFAHRETSSGRWLQMEVGGFELSGKTWGIIGFGAIGTAVAERLIPFGVRVLYHDVKRDPEREKNLKAAYAELHELLKASDIVSLHCPLTDETRDLLGGNELAMMKPNAYLINVARGEVVDEDALAAALAGKKIAGAGIDVYHHEPIDPGNPLLSLRDVNLIMTPHSAGTTIESRLRIGRMAFTNIARVLNGEKPQNLVN